MDYLLLIQIFPALFYLFRSSSTYVESDSKCNTLYKYRY